MPDCKPSRPVLIYDGRCAFCARWVHAWRSLTGTKVEYVTADEAQSRFPEVPPSRLAEAVQLVTGNGQVLSGAAAAFGAFASAGQPWLWRLYRSAPGFALAAERLYRAVASHRELAGRLDRRLLGSEARPLARLWVLRALAAGYFVVPLSAMLLVQRHRLLARRRMLRAAAPWRASWATPSWLFSLTLGAVCFAPRHAALGPVAPKTVSSQRGGTAQKPPLLRQPRP